MNKRVFDLFDQIRQVPRSSKHEERISQWLCDFAQKNGIDYVQDGALNVIMRVPATPGLENASGVILQAHMDMVCEKNGDVNHDFMTDPIETFVDGDWLKAKGTTLGGDDGIGMAMALAALTDKQLRHPAMEALFTVDEETGLTGAEKLQDGYLKGQRLINLDSEDDGQIFIGCAGGVETVGRMHYAECRMHNAECTMQNAECTMFAFRVSVKGLLGGHSGDDINKGRANANKIIASFLSLLSTTELLSTVNFQLSTIQGGNLRNAIAREAEAVFAVKAEMKHEVVAAFNHYQSDVERLCGDVERDMRLELESWPMPETFIPQDKAQKLIDTLVACPHGMMAMTPDMPNLVQTSTNLASVKMKDGYIEICTSQRSSLKTELHTIRDRVAQVLSIACDEVESMGEYPGWAPNTQSPLMETTRQAYRDLFNDEPQVLVIHAGLECGLFLEKYPYLDMVSIGPQMYGVHSPQERLSISSTDRCYDWLCRVLSTLA